VKFDHARLNSSNNSLSFKWEWSELSTDLDDRDHLMIINNEKSNVEREKESVSLACCILQSPRRKKAALVSRASAAARVPWPVVSKGTLVGDPALSTARDVTLPQIINLLNGKRRPLSLAYTHSPLG
jgi:hypothetical protein